MTLRGARILSIDDRPDGNVGENHSPMLSCAKASRAAGSSRIEAQRRVPPIQCRRGGRSRPAAAELARVSIRPGLVRRISETRHEAEVEPIIRDNVIEAVRKLKAAPGKNILTDGSRELATFKLKAATPYPSGVVGLHYERER
jgi:hypothetical protein